MTPIDVIIVGAPRSGTNMLRDVLSSLSGAATWPCDEINLIWQHGNRGFGSDELTAAHATPRVASYIQHEFDQIRSRYGAPIVVEKTCATSLRTQFARACLPDAKFIFITRDGIDAAASAMQRWNAPLDLRYTARKARFVPITDVPHYGRHFLARQLRRRHGDADGLQSWWGPRPHDYRQLMSGHPLDEVCALQWQRCVDSAERGLSGLDADHLMRVVYEDFVSDPGNGLRHLADFLGVPLEDPEPLVAGVSASSVGKGRHALSEDRRGRLETLVEPTLARLSYV